MRRLGAGVPVVIFISAVAGNVFNEANAARHARPAARGEDAGILGRTLTLRTDGRTPAYEVVFRSGDGRREERVAVAGGYFVVEIGRARSSGHPLSASGGGLTTVKVVLRQGAWTGLRRAMGLPPPSDYEVVLEPQAR